MTEITKNRSEGWRNRQQRNTQHETDGITSFADEEVISLQRFDDLEHQSELRQFPSHEDEETVSPQEQTTLRRHRPIRNRQPIGRQQLQRHFSAVHRLERFSAKCPKCEAKHWIEEKTANSSIQNPEFSMCCAKGKVYLQPSAYPPTELSKYFLDQSQGKCIVKISTQNHKNVITFSCLFFSWEELS
jgi:hypothetical protein